MVPNRIDAEALQSLPPDPTSGPHPRPDETRDFARVYEEYFDFVWRFVAHHGVSEAVQDDVVQEVFVIVHARLSSFEGRSTLRSWIGGITRNVVRDFLRKRRHRPAGDTEIDEGHACAAGESPVRALEKKRASDVLGALLGRLPEQQRTVFILCELDQLSSVEAAEVLQVNENTVRTRLRAARKNFNGLMARWRAQETWRERD